MKAKYFILIFLISIWGCAHVIAHSPAVTQASKSPKEAVTEEAKILISPPAEKPMEPPKAGEESQPPLEIGSVFAKTMFEGVVKTSYVTLTITDTAESRQSYQLIIGDRERQKDFPWEVQTVGPGYFLVELPAGEYRFSAITIPVGQKTATEPMDVVFQVESEKTAYLGTLKVVGTKEKIKLGGVPVIKPGFEYRIEVLDQTSEAESEFSRRFGKEEISFTVDLMQIRMTDNLSLPESLSQPEEPVH